MSEAHPRFRGMHVGVDVRRGQRDRQGHEGKPVARQERPVRGQDRLEERGVTHGTPVDRQHDFVAPTAREVGRTHPAVNRHAVLVVLHGEEPAGNVISPDGAETLA